MTKPEPQRRLLQGRIVEIIDAGPDTRILSIETEHRQRPAFYAGQYALLSFSGLAEKPFSIASSPEAPLLEFHIRNTRSGDAASTLETVKTGTPVTIDLPYGDNYLNKTGRSIVMIAGGMGVAPMKSIIETCLAEKSPHTLALYWGVRDKSHLYLDDYFRKLAHENAGFSYIPVVSDQENSGIREGFPVDAALEDLFDIETADIYMAGPPSMTELSLARLLESDCEIENIYCDGIKKT